MVLPRSILKQRKVTGQREVWGQGRVIIKMGGFSKCLSDGDWDPNEDGEAQEREKVPGRAGTKMGANAAQSPGKEQDFDPS